MSGWEHEGKHSPQLSRNVSFSAAIRCNPEEFLHALPEKDTDMPPVRFRCHSCPERPVSVTLTGAASQPRIRILNAVADGAQLQCDVQDAFPKPEVEWRDVAGNVLPAETTQVSEKGGRYDVTALVTVTKADTVRCVVTQQEINHVTAAETYVPFSGQISLKSVCSCGLVRSMTRDTLTSCVSENVCEDPPPEVHIGWWFVRLVLGASLLIAVASVLVATKCIQMHLH